MTTCPFALDDGAYVLGALAPAERAAFERHLPDCAACRDAVANIAVLPGLLARLDPATAAATGQPAQSGPITVLDRLIAKVKAWQRTRRRNRRLAFAAVSLLLVVAVGLGVQFLNTGGNAVSKTPMVPVAAQLPVSAELGVTPVHGGSQIAMTCWYESGYPSGTWTLRLVVFSRAGGPGDQVGTWTASSGDEVNMTARTHLAPNEIDHIELQKADHTPLLTWHSPN